MTPKLGDIFELPLPTGMHGYGHVLGAVLMGYYDIETTQHLAPAEVVRHRVAFRAQTRTNRIKKGEWPIVGNAEPPPAMSAPIAFWRGEPPDGLRIYEWTREAGGHERSATPADIAGLEKDVIWDSAVLPQRLQMHLRGEPCPWVKVG